MSESTRRSLSRARRRGMHLCLWETAFSQIYVTLTGGAFLVGFALLLGAGPLVVGTLAALPFFAQAAQIVGAWLTDRTGNRKRLTLLLIGAGRALWLVLIPLGFMEGGRATRIGLLLVVALASGLALAGAVPWLSWLGDLVPQRVRGRWIGRRQQIIAVVAVACSLGGGLLVDTLSASRGGGTAFAVLFGLAGLAAVGSAGLLLVQPDPFSFHVSPLGLRGAMLEIRGHRGFRRVLASLLVWNVAIGVAAPFFALFMFRDLRMSFTQVAIHTSLMAVTAVATNPFWGRLVDRWGVRPALLTSGCGIVLVPLFWLLPAPDRLWPIWIEAIYAGTVWTGFNLAAFSLPFAVTPARGRGYFLALLSMLTGLGYGLASLAGGVLVKGLEHAMPAEPLETPWGSPFLAVHVAFLLSALLRLAGVLTMRGIREPRSRATGAMIQVVGYGVLRRLSLGRQWFLAPREEEAEGKKQTGP